MKKRPHGPWVPPSPPTAVTLALKGLATGTANEHQQRAALKWIITDLCGTYDLSYRPDSQRDTDFAEGKRSIGLALVHEVNLDNALLRSKSP